MRDTEGGGIQREEGKRGRREREGGGREREGEREMEREMGR